MNRSSGVRLFATMVVVSAVAVLLGVLLLNRDAGELQTGPDVRRGGSAENPPNLLTNMPPMPTGVARADHHDESRDQTIRVLQFRVVDVNRSPIPMAKALLGRGTFFATPLTGEFRLVLSTERTTLSVLCSGYLPQEIEIEAGKSDVDLGDVQLSAKEALRVSVTDEEGAPKKGAEIWIQVRDNEAFAGFDNAITNEGAGWFAAGTTDNSGQLLVERGLFACTLFAAVGNVRSEWVAVTPPETEVTLVMPQEANLRLLFVDGEGVPVPSLPFELRIGRETISQFIFSAASDEQGRVEARLPKGVYSPFFPTFEWYTKRHSDSRIQVTANVVEQTIVLKRGFGISVRARPRTSAI